MRGSTGRGSEADEAAAADTLGRCGCWICGSDGCGRCGGADSPTSEINTPAGGREIIGISLCCCRGGCTYFCCCGGGGGGSSGTGMRISATAAGAVASPRPAAAVCSSEGGGAVSTARSTAPTVVVAAAFDCAAVATFAWLRPDGTCGRPSGGGNRAGRRLSTSDGDATRRRFARDVSRRRAPIAASWRDMEGN